MEQSNSNHTERNEVTDSTVAVNDMMQRAGSPLIRALKGFVMGVAGMLPGASGGVLAVAMGIYRPVLEAVTGLFRSFKRNILFVLPVLIGGIIGLLSVSRLMEYVLREFREPVMFLMIGMVVGGVPSFIVEANDCKGGFKPRYLIGTVAGVAFILGFAYLQKHLTGGEELPFNGWTAALCGGLIAVGTVIPGISTSFILMYMGLYDRLLGAVNSFNIPMLLCALAGGLVVAAALVLFVKRMFERHHGYTYYAVLGFLSGSIVLIFPGFTAGILILWDILLLIAGAVISFFMCRIKPKEPQAE